MRRTMTLWLQGQESSWLKDISYMFSFPERGGQTQVGVEEEGGERGGGAQLADENQKS